MLFVVVLSAGLLAAIAFAFYANVTKKYPGANDFYVPWRATRALLLEGRDPYSAGVTRDIQLGLFGRAVPANEHQWGFAYPLYTAFLLAPLIGLPYDVAQAIWHSLTLAMLIASVAFLLDVLGWKLRPVALLGLLTWLLAMYPTVRAFVLGQLAIVVFVSLVVAWWCVDKQRDVMAGGLLAIATIKPQMVVLLAPVSLWWALERRRLGVIKGFVVTFSALFGLALIWQPAWIMEFLGSAGTYSGYFDSPSPVQIILGDSTAAVAVSAALLLTVAVAAIRASRAGWPDSSPTFVWSIIVTQLVAIHTSTPNQLLLLPTLLLGISRLPRGTRRNAFSLITLVGFLAGPWIVFFASRSGNQEMPPAFLPLSCGVAVWWFVAQWLRSNWRRSAVGEPA